MRIEIANISNLEGSTNQRIKLIETSNKANLNIQIN